MMRFAPVALVFTLACASAPTKTAAPSSTVQVDCGNAEGALTAVIANPARSEAHRARDVYRHPKETLSFMGLTPSLHVVELWPGGGWYTEILAPMLVPCGKLTVVRATQKDEPPAPPPPGVTAVDIDTAGDFSFGPDASEDLVLTFRNIHNWVMGGYEPKIYAAAFKALKPGGVFGVVEHRAKPGIDEAKSGYVDEDAAIKRITAAGFVLEEKSEINANPKDTKDYPGGVWTLPPTLRNGDVDKAKYLAIGESDRMTLRFRKPK